jgi:hypothetical protein
MMKRYLLSLIILFVGLGWLAMGAPVWGGQSLLQPTEEKPEEPDAVVTLSADQKLMVEDIILENSALKGMILGPDSNREPLIRVQSYVSPDITAAKRGSVLALANVFFDPPISFSGELPRQTNPCEGYPRVDGAIPEDAPCWDLPVEFITEYVEWHDITTVTVVVDIQEKKVVVVWKNGPTIEDFFPERAGQ